LQWRILGDITFYLKYFMFTIRIYTIFSKYKDFKSCLKRLSKVAPIINKLY